MGVVANRAGRLIDRIIPMGLLKGSRVDVMAAQAKWIFRFHQKILLVRTVGEMTGHTAFSTDFVGYFLLVIVFLMTLKASLVPFCFQKVAVLRSMGIVTLDALSSS